MCIYTHVSHKSRKSEKNRKNDEKGVFLASVWGLCGVKLHDYNLFYTLQKNDIRFHVKKFDPPPEDPMLSGNPAARKWSVRKDEGFPRFHFQNVPPSTSISRVFLGHFFTFPSPRSAFPGYPPKRPFFPVFRRFPAVSGPGPDSQIYPP
jgi:hypothetical protein